MDQRGRSSQSDFGCRPACLAARSRSRTRAALSSQTRGPPLREPARPAQPMPGMGQGSWKNTGRASLGSPSGRGGPSIGPYAARREPSGPGRHPAPDRRTGGSPSLHPAHRQVEPGLRGRRKREEDRQHVPAAPVGPERAAARRQPRPGIEGAGRGLLPRLLDRLHRRTGRTPRWRGSSGRILSEPTIGRQLARCGW